MKIKSSKPDNKCFVLKINRTEIKLSRLRVTISFFSLQFASSAAVVPYLLNLSSVSTFLHVTYSVLRVAPFIVILPRLFVLAIFVPVLKCQHNKRV